MQKELVIEPLFLLLGHEAASAAITNTEEMNMKIDDCRRLARFGLRRLTLPTSDEQTGCSAAQRPEELTS